jgi:CSLREA domain-containing protein
MKSSSHHPKRLVVFVLALAVSVGLIAWPSHPWNGLTKAHASAAGQSGNSGANASRVSRLKPDGLELSSVFNGSVNTRLSHRARAATAASTFLLMNTITVTTTANTIASDGQCSLREAIINANNDAATHPDCAAGSGADTIVLAAGATYTLNARDNTEYGFNGLPAITSEITIEGNGATITRSGSAPTFRLFYIAITGNLTLRNMVLSNGNAKGGNGGGLSGGGGGAGLGGGIYNRGLLTVFNSTLRNNQAIGGFGGSGKNGAGGGGGGGLGGNGGSGGGHPSTTVGGGGGGGFGGDGGVGGVFQTGGGGGGTITNGSVPTGGVANGGNGGSASFIGGAAGGPGGGGGGGGATSFGSPGVGGAGGIGGGGGGGGNGCNGGGRGGGGGFGGGGGGGGNCGSVGGNDGGSGGFGGGGGGGGFVSSVGGGSLFGGGSGGGGARCCAGPANGGGGGGAGLGGAVFNDGGTITLTNSTLSSNSAQGGSGGSGHIITTDFGGTGGGGGSAHGGAIFNLNGSATLTHCTLTSNIVQAGGGGTGVGSGSVGSKDGGAIYNLQQTGGTAILNLANNTLTGNTINAIVNNGGTLNESSCSAITLSPASLPSGAVGATYSQTITASGGTAPYTFAVTSGGLPDGLTLSSNGLLSGTPTAGCNFSFTITATDANNCTGSQSYSLTINDPPAISDQPDSQTKCVGESVTFSVTASGAGLTYQWRKGGTNITGATGSSYTIASVGAGDAGDYDVVVSGTCGAPVTSSLATLSVITSPTITTQPGDQTVCVGAPASFSVVANGTGPFTYQWRKNSVNISGANGDTYSIASVTASDAGSYDVVVTSATCGSSVTSNAATLTVNPATGISSQPVSQTVCAGAQASFSVTASGTGPFTYQWRKNGTNIGGATDSTYSIAAVVASDAGNYDVVVTGACGSATSNLAALTVNLPPAITSQPVSLTRSEGQSATFSVTATGAGLTYQWRKNGSNLAGATGSSYTIASVTSSDAGSYDVVVSGICSPSVTSAVATLTVNTAPTTASFFLHGTGPNNNPPTLFLDNASPTATTAKFRDSLAINFSGGNPWKEIGTWPAASALTTGTLNALDDLHVWLGLKNSDDQGTRFDLRAEVYQNGTLVAAGETYCIEGVTRNANLAKEVAVTFAPFTPVTYSATDVLTLKIWTRIGSNGAGGFCGGHSNAVGLRLYFDAINRPSRFGATF